MCGKRVILTLMAGMCLAARALSAQFDEPSDSLLSPDCRLANRIRAIGESDSRYDWAVRKSFFCPTSESPALRKLWREDKADTTRLNTIYHKSRELWDQKLLESVRAAAVATRRPLHIRLNAIRTLASYAYVRAYVPSLDSLPTTADSSRKCVSRRDINRRFNTEEAPPEGSVDGVISLLQQLAHTDSTPRVRFAAACVLDHLSPRIAAVSDRSDTSAAFVSVAGDLTCVATTKGRVICWGSEFKAPPTPFPGVANVSALSVGTSDTCVLMDSLPHCWTNWFPPFEPVQRAGVTLRAISTGWPFCGVSFEGHGICWDINPRVRKKGQVPILPGSTVQRIRSGHGVTCAIKADGGMACWGVAGFGLLHDLRMVERLPEDAVSPLHAPTSITDVSSERSHACLLTQQGAVWCWGSNEFGQLGNDTLAATDRCDTMRSHHSPGRSMVRCSRRALQVEGPRFTSIAVGREHSCAIAADSTAYCWGANAKGQLGRGSRDTLANSRPRPVAGGWRWRAIAAGSNHTCGITAANVVHCWGDNSLRQLGMPGQFKLVPTYVPIRRDRKSR